MHWIEHFVRQTHGKAFVLFTNFKLMREIGELMQPFFDRTGIAVSSRDGHAAFTDARKI